MYETLPQLLKLVFNCVSFWPIHFLSDSQPRRICSWPRTVSPCTCSRKRTMCLTRITLTCIRTWADHWLTTTSLPLIIHTWLKTKWPVPAALSLISGTIPTHPHLIICLKHLIDKSCRRKHTYTLFCKITIIAWVCVTAFTKLSLFSDHLCCVLLHWLGEI